jgi:hypothetical protein
MRLVTEQREGAIRHESVTTAGPSLDLSGPLEEAKRRLANELAVELLAEGLMPYVYSYGYYADRPLLKVTYFSDISLADFKRLPGEFRGLPVEVAPATRARLDTERCLEARFYPIEEAFSEAFRHSVSCGHDSEQALERAIRAARALLP